MSAESLIFGAVALALGLLAGYLYQSRKTLIAQTELHQKEDLLEQSEVDKAQLRTDLNRVQAQVHALEVAKGQLEERLNGAAGNEAQLKQQMADRLAELRTSQQQSLEDLKSLQARYESLLNENSVLKTTVREKEQYFRDQLEQLNTNRQALTKEFENIANKIFEEKGKTFANTSQSSLDMLLKPFREQLEGFQKRVNDIHESSTRENAHLNAEIKKVMEIGMKMSKEATSLTSALKGDSQQRGAWGEAQLRRTLEMSGLVEEVHYEAQSSFKDAEGRVKQTDYLIKLPDGKHIIIDSKVSLNAYDRAVSAESPEAQELAMAEHFKAVRSHIDDLASKDYTNVLGMRSPSFVLMFMPIEPAYIEALKSNRDLFDYGYRKGVVLVSHTTLIPILRTVSNLWMIERSNAEAREISEKAGDIFNTVSLLADRLAKLGASLSTASGHYNKTVTALSGKQGLYGKVDRFRQLSTKISRDLPAVEHQHLDFEADKLQMIVEELPAEESVVEPETDPADIEATQGSELKEE